MAKLLGTEKAGDRTEKWWLHTGDDGKDRITLQVVQESDAIIDAVARRREATIDRNSAFRFKASIPATLIEEAARVKAAEWGESYLSVFREIVSNKTDRAKSVWALLSEGRDFRKFQASK